jgi:hypothetical protein
MHLMMTFLTTSKRWFWALNLNRRCPQLTPHSRIQGISSLPLSAPPPSYPDHCRQHPSLLPPSCPLQRLSRAASGTFRSLFASGAGRRTLRYGTEIVLMFAQAVLHSSGRGERCWRGRESCFTRGYAFGLEIACDQGHFLCAWNP